MTRHWNELEGVSISGRYCLKQCLYSTANEAWYLTRFDAVSDAAIRLMRADAAEAAGQLEAWRETLKLEHPHIAAALDAGSAEVDGTDLIYVVCEYPDDILADAVAERSLSDIESRKVLSACLPALGFLHGKGLAHGSVDPAHIVSIRDEIKLTCDTIGRAGASEAEDMWGFGATLVEILTRERPVPGGEIPDIPEPFATIVHHTCRLEPVERWSVEDIEAHLHPPAAAPAPEPQAAPLPDIISPLTPPPDAAGPTGPPDAPSRRGLPLKWMAAAGLLAAVVLSAGLWRHAGHPAARPAVQAALDAAPAPEPAPARLPSAAPPAAQAAPPVRGQSGAGESAVWRVVAYEYATRPAAEREARRINAMRPAWRAEVFAPRPNHGPYLVSLGGGMTRAEAERLKKEARAKGLPRDTFIRNFPR